MEINHHTEDRAGRFEAIADSEKAGEMTYEWTGETIITIDHTEVNPSFSGQGIGNKLVAAAVDFAERKGFTIRPVCPFAKRVLEKNPAWAKFVAPGE